MSMTSSRPSIAELRAFAQPTDVIGRVSGEHWAGRLYMRKASLHLTRVLLPTRVTPDGLTWAMIVAGLGAAVVLTVPHWWAALIAVALVQLQLLLDCSDGELARWRRQNNPSGIYLDRIGHYVTDGGLAAAVGVHAGGGLGSLDGWATIGLFAATLVLLTKAETDLVHVARAAAGLPRAVDDIATATPGQSSVRRVRSLAGRLPFNRALLAVEMTVLALAASLVDAGRGDLTAMRVLSVALAAIGGVVVAGHLLGVLTSRRLRP
jgi:phosphatidylglycerophosphate synthase